jgi:N-acetylneuraminic acid mutarotase
VNYNNIGLRYDPATDTWLTTSITGAPTGRYFHTAVWTGTEMILWGGYGCIDANCSSFSMLGDGARYNPTTDSWNPISSVSAPSARFEHSVVWTGNMMIIWGGCGDSGCSDILSSGARYYPASNSWQSTDVSNAPVNRYFHTAVWSGSEMIIWGGCSDNYCYVSLDTGSRYNPVSNAWQNISSTNAPLPRAWHSALWAGNKMIIWGGWGCIDTACSDFTEHNTGGLYNPTTNSWTATNATNAPTARDSHTAIWTSTEMIIWGGYGCTDETCSIIEPLNTGTRFNPASNSWTSISIIGAPSGRGDHTAVWTGSEMIVWGGLPTGITGGRYNPSTNSWSPTSIAGLGGFSPSKRSGHTSVWTGAEMIIWGGSAGDWINTGARYDLVTDSWTPTNLIGAPDGRAYHTTVWTGKEMIIWGGYGDNGYSTGARYNPVKDQWTATSTASAPTERFYHTAVWTGSEMIVWGGSTYDQTGGRYNPSTDSWIAIGTANAPYARIRHSAVWANDRMIVWGGRGCTMPPPGCSSAYLNTGGIYNPVNDAWQPTNLSNAPSPRRYHGAIWNGSKMIIWGGWDGIIPLESGGLFDPNLNNWQSVSIVNAPTARYGIGIVWTGSEMIIWGGSGCIDTLCSSTGTLKSGARYNPLTDIWTATSLSGAPYPCPSLTAVWTGSVMIIWGGPPGGIYSIFDLALLSHKPAIDDSGSSTPNGIIETNETFSLIGNLQNIGILTASSVTGSLTTTDPITIINANAVYPDIAPGTNQICSTCYSAMVPSANRLETHWDITVRETPACSGCNATWYEFYYHVGNSFNDVPPSELFYSYIETLLHSGVAAGCASSYYCPLASVSREQMSKFICISMNKKESGSCNMKNCTGLFADVSISNPFCSSIEALYTAGVVAGCQSSPLLYCPGSLVQRQQMAKFICSAMNATIPGRCATTVCSGLFTDVPSTNPFCSYIEGIYQAGVASGCQSSPMMFCPNNNVSREQMSKFIVYAFDFAL